MIANWSRFSASHSMLAPRSSMTLSPRRVGKNDAIAGRSMPGSVLNTIFAVAISAPVLPAETMPCASPAATASMARRMLELRPLRSAVEGLSSLVMTSVVCRIVDTAASAGRFARSGAIRASSPTIRKCTSG
jgi:hypothetical protein